MGQTPLEDNDVIEGNLPAVVANLRRRPHMAFWVITALLPYSVLYLDPASES